MNDNYYYSDKEESDEYSSESDFDEFDSMSIQQGLTRAKIIRDIGIEEWNKNYKENWERSCKEYKKYYHKNSFYNSDESDEEDE